MAKIIGLSARVVVWLGEAANNSDLALEEKRAVNHKVSAVSSPVAY